MIANHDITFIVFVIFIFTLIYFRSCILYCFILLCCFSLFFILTLLTCSASAGRIDHSYRRQCGSLASRENAHGNATPIAVSSLRWSGVDTKCPTDDLSQSGVLYAPVERRVRPEEVDIHRTNVSMIIPVDFAEVGRDPERSDPSVALWRPSVILRSHSRNGIPEATWVLLRCREATGGD